MLIAVCRIVITEMYHTYSVIVSNNSVVIAHYNYIINTQYSHKGGPKKKKNYLKRYSAENMRLI